MLRLPQIYIWGTPQTYQESLRFKSKPKILPLVKRSETYQPGNFQGQITNRHLTPHSDEYVIDDVMEVKTLPQTQINQALQQLKRWQKGLKWWMGLSSLGLTGLTSWLYIRRMDYSWLVPVSLAGLNLGFSLNRILTLQDQYRQGQKLKIEYICAQRQLCSRLGVNQIYRNDWVGKYLTQEEGLELWNQESAKIFAILQNYSELSLESKSSILNQVFMNSTPWERQVMAYYGIVQPKFSDCFDSLQKLYTNIANHYESTYRQLKQVRDRATEKLNLTGQYGPGIDAFRQIFHRSQLIRICDNYEYTSNQLTIAYERDLNSLSGSINELINLIGN